MTARFAALFFLSPLALFGCGSSDASSAPVTTNGGSGGSAGAPVAPGGASAAGTGGTAGITGSGGFSGQSTSGGAGGSDVVGGAAGANAGGTAGAVSGGSAGATMGGAPPCTAHCPQSKIEHLVVLVQENHTFDTHFGRYCTAASGSNPTCTDGPACCEAGPDTDPSGALPTILDDVEHAKYNPNHSEVCEAAEIDGGQMDQYVTNSCGSAENFAYAAPSLVQPYWDRAATGALADRYFQPIVGASAANDMYFARAGYVFTDNAFEPENAVGSTCVGGPYKSYTDLSLGDLLDTAGVSWAVYAEGRADAAAGPGGCLAKAPADCEEGLPVYPCAFDPGDIPFEYYASTVNQPGIMRDLTQLDADLAGDELPAFTFIKLVGYKNEHPGFGIKLSDGVTAATAVMDKILASKYGASSLVLLTYDEGGGYFDHVSPPPASTVDQEPYGTRVPTLALGPFARKNYVSHVVLEHSSIVRFVEWNWLGATGQLGQRDAVVNNLGSLLDPATTGVTVPEGSQ